MPQTEWTIAEAVEIGQIALGMVLLVMVPVYFAITGRLRRAFAFPPPVPNGLSGGHLLLMLAAFIAINALLATVFTAVGILPPEPPAATQPAPQPAPPDEAPWPEPDARPKRYVDNGEQDGTGGRAVACGPVAARGQTPPAAMLTDAMQALHLGGGFLRPRSWDQTPVMAAMADAAPGPDGQDDEAARRELGELVILALTEIILIGIGLMLVRSTFAGGLKGFGLRTDRLGRDAFWGVTSYLAFWPICVALAALTQIMLELLVPDWEPLTHQVVVFMTEPGKTALHTILAWMLAGVIAPIFEEIFFRGLLLTWARQASGSTWLAIVFTGVAFGLIHAPYYQTVVALAALGILLGYLYVRTGSLTLVILLHATFNMRTLLVVTLFGDAQ